MYKTFGIGEGLCVVLKYPIQDTIVRKDYENTTKLVSDMKKIKCWVKMKLSIPTAKRVFLNTWHTMDLICSIHHTYECSPQFPIFLI